MADRRIFPAIDIIRSGTRKEELLLRPDELECTWVLRKVLGSLGANETAELIMDRINHTKSNEEFRELIMTSSFAENVLKNKRNGEH